MFREKNQKIKFIDLEAQQRVLGEKLPQALKTVLEHGGYILGPEVNKLEDELSSCTGATDVISCANGTDALRLLLMAYDIGPGDAVFVPTFTFAATAEVIAQANATPIFVDICPQTYNLDTNSLQQAIEKLDKKLTPKGIIGVDLFGLPANYPAIQKIADHYNLWLIADAAQSFGGEIQGKKVGTLATTTATSFFPSKPLSCYGDGGAIFTANKEMGDLLRSLRNHGCGTHRYDHIRIGLNSRLDTLQAAILIEKLRIFPLEIARRKEIATFYSSALKNVVDVPVIPPEFSHAWGIYTILCRDGKREKLMNALEERGIPTNIYYQKPLHLQPAYQHFPRASQQLTNAESLSEKVLSLPMHPYLTNAQLDYITHTILSILESPRSGKTSAAILPTELNV